MLQKLQRYFLPLVEAEAIDLPRKQFEASMLNISIAIISITCVVMLSYFTFISTSTTAAPIYFLYVTLAVQFIVYGLSRAGYRYLAFQIDLMFIFFVLGYGSFFSGGLYSTTTMLFFLIFLISGTILSYQFNIFLALLTIAYFAAIYIVEVSGGLPDAPLKDLPYRFILMSIMTLATTLILLFHRYSLQEAEQARIELQTTAERLRVQQQLTQDLAHDLRTPLTSLNTSLYLLKKFHETGRDPTRYIDRLENSVSKLQIMIEGFFELSVLDASPISGDPIDLPIDIGALVQDTVESCQTLAQKEGVTLCLKIASTSTVMGQPGQIERVVSNLVSNAIHYGKGGEVVEVEVGRKHQSAVISVTDFGIGISEVHHTKIFERFYRVNTARTGSEHIGTGIGLAICKRIVENHGGRIELESQLGQGSTFKIHLPAL